MKLLKNHSAIEARWCEVASDKTDHNSSQLSGTDKDLLQSMLCLLGSLKKKRKQCDIATS